jgi:hypothetical protein
MTSAVGRDHRSRGLDQGEVSYASGSFTLSLTDNTTGATFSTVQASKKAARSAVEWIVEGP